jgi:tRNA1Val (adenine37-N6)-methyltransferase
MSTFRFKQFELQQDKCAMKIGTDGVLLGAWANIVQASSILDIGTGTGVLALMAAQRNAEALIDAVEINPAAQLQAQANFAKSPWSTRLRLHPCSLQDYSLQHPLPIYDSIICNPPYYPSGRHSSIAQKARRQARSTVDLEFDALLKATVLLLAPMGNLSLILPTSEAQEFWKLAQKQSWYLAQQVAVVPRVGKASNRTLLELKRQPCQTVQQTLILRPKQQKSGRYTAAFEALHRDFLLFL